MEGNEYYSAWSLDSQDLFVASDRHGTAAANIYRIVADGSGAAERLTTSQLDQPPYALSPDGSAVFYVEGRRSDTGFDIWMLPLQGELDPVPVLTTQYDEINPTVSADGRWLAYASNDTGRWEIYLRFIANPAEVVRVSMDGGMGPLWSRDGRTLFYRSGGSRMMAVPVTTHPTLRVGDPQLLFELEGSYEGDSALGRGWDLAPDGRFLFLLNEERAERPTEYRVVVGWGRDLRGAMSPDR
jgi:Tol biopolymer transport system component